MSTESTKTTFSVPTIRCGGCAEAIGEALNRIDGVDAVDVDVDVQAKTVAVEHEPRISRESLEAALEKAGFPAA